MPLYEFRCNNCDTVATILMKSTDKSPLCDNCGSASMTKLMSRFSTRTSNPKSGGASSFYPASEKANKQHVKASPCFKKHSHSHSQNHDHGHCSGHHSHSTGSGCAGSQAEKLIKVHDKIARPTEIKSVSSK